MSLVKVKNFPDRIIAEMAQQHLEADGIYSVLKGAGGGTVSIGGIGGAVGFCSQGIDLYVEEAIAEKAIESLADFYMESSI